MDSITQIVLGAAVGEAVIGKKVGRWAAFWGGVAGTIPDLDVFVSYFTDNISSLAIHRGFTHSFV
ncbi:MAG: metal-dependent hydrolase, partial [Vicingaceae bacterium]